MKDERQRNKFRQNYGLLIMILITFTVLFAIVVYFTRSFVSSNIQNDFVNRKSEIYDQTVAPFNDFFQNRIPEISFYQGFVENNEARRYAGSILSSYAFVEEVVFFNLEIGNDPYLHTNITVNNLRIGAKDISMYALKNHQVVYTDIKTLLPKTMYSEELSGISLKLATFVGNMTADTKLTDKDIFSIFYSIKPGQVSYLNIPRVADLQAYKSIMDRKMDHHVAYKQDLFSFKIDPLQLVVKNSYPNLYEKIDIIPVVSAPQTTDLNELVTEIVLPGAMSDYKILFHSSEKFLEKEVNRSFLPYVIGEILVYLILVIILYLLYRNFEINSRLFKLQYDFINNLTHEFKTPVSVIKIAGNNIKSASELSETERKMYGNILDQEADRLNNLMNKLLSFSQIENKTMKMKVEEIDLSEFTENLVNSTLLNHRDFAISTNIDVRSVLKVDPTLLSIVFQNLIDNAYKYSNARQKELKINITQNKKNFVIEFIDNGIGIAKNEFSNIFKKFYRIKSQYNQQGSIGLGLAFCKEITEFMGGEISVKSQMNQGTTFTIIFPVV